MQKQQMANWLPGENPIESSFNNGFFMILILFFCFLLGIVFFAKNVKSHMIDSQPVFKPISWIVCASKVASKYQN